MTYFNSYKLNKEIITGIILSLIFHAFLFLFEFNNRNISLGDKFIPIDLLNDDSSKLSKGNSLKKIKQIDQNSIAKPTEEKLKEDSKKIEKIVESDELEKIIKKIEKKDIKDIKEEKSVDKIKYKESNTNIVKTKIEKIKGNRGEIFKDQLEKGSIKGKGKLKITCFNCAEPIYPKLAIKRGYEGILKLKIWIRKNGTVSEVKIIKSTGYNILDLSGMEAAKNSKFFPIDKEATLNIEYDLRLN